MSDNSEWYRRYDAAFAKLPADVRGKASLTGAGEDPYTGVITFRDNHGRELARVDLHGHVVVVESFSLEADEKCRIEEGVRKGVAAQAAGIQQRAARAAIDVCTVLLNQHMKAATSRIDDVESRVGGALTLKSLDTAACESLVELAERVERIERKTEELADRAWTFRGYWNPGASANRCDVFTHDGSAWIAVRGTNQTPAHGCSDWHLLARKGSDARK